MGVSQKRQLGQRELQVSAVGLGGCPSEIHCHHTQHHQTAPTG